MPIKRHIALQPLSRDHHRGLILAQLIKKGAPEYKGLPTTPSGKKEYTISFFEKELKQHFLDEENILFTTAGGRNSETDKAIDAILTEHREIHNLVSRIGKSSDYENLLDELGKKLEVHIRKEERELFPQIEELLSEKELSELEKKFKR